jgi:hypothetical protein
MSSTSRTYIDPMTDEALLYQWDPEHGGWIPDIAAMAAWRTGNLRLYRPTAATDTFVTMPGHVHRPAMTEVELRDICATASRPWIPVAAIPTMSEPDIASFDVWSHTMESPATPVPTTWESVAVPLLHYGGEITTRFFPSFNHDDNNAVAALLTIRHEISVPTAPPVEQPSPQQQELPRHVATLVLEQAITSGATCPISMEPIQAVGASVTGCGHVFQTAALRRWMADRNTCPECRAPTAATAF